MAGKLQELACLVQSERGIDIKQVVVKTIMENSACRYAEGYFTAIILCSDMHCNPDYIDNLLGYFFDCTTSIV